MTYTEWRDELKSNLLCVSESERRRVLEYYAEAYADRREAGFSEREIIEEFGAPYDAAQRILHEDDREEYEPPQRRGHSERRERRAPERDEYFDEPPQRREHNERRERRVPERDEYFDEPPARSHPQEDRTERNKTTAQNKVGKTSWVFVVLCIVFAAPIFSIIVSLCVMTVAAFAAPFAVLIAGIGEVGIGVGVMFSSVLEGVMRVGAGLMLFGVGVILISILPRLAGLVWTVFKKIGGFIKSLFTTEVA